MNETLFELLPHSMEERTENLSGNIFQVVVSCINYGVLLRFNNRRDEI